MRKKHHKYLYMRKFATIALIILCSVASIMVIGQTSKSSSKLKQDKQQLEKEIKKTQQLLNETRKSKKASLAELSVIKNQISNRESMLATLNNEMHALEAELALNEKLSKDLSKKLMYMKDDYARVVYNAYRNRKFTNKIIFILSAEDFGQMYRRSKYYSEFAQDVKDQVAAIENTQEEIAAKLQEIEQIKREKAAVVITQEKNLASLENERREKNKLASNLKAKEKELSTEIANKQKKQKQLDAAIQQAIQREIAAANAKNNKNKGGKKGASGSGTSSGTSSSNKTNTTAKPGAMTLTPEEQQLNTTFVANKGKLPWPLAKCSKIKGYGSYPHPTVPSVMLSSNGWDLLTDAGASVRSVFQGEVTTVTEVCGTKLVIIRHGEYMTVYQNLATISVSKGQKVTTKQSIGTVAKNANDGTYVLHFSLLKLQTYLDPAAWLAR